MHIRTVTTHKYRGARIYIRNFANVFEYLVSLRGQVYTTHVVVTRTIWQRLMGRGYTSKQLEDISNYLIKTAEATVDFVLLPKDKKAHHGHEQR